MFILEGLITRLLNPLQLKKGKKQGSFPIKEFYDVSKVMVHDLRELYGEYKKEGELWTTFLKRRFSLNFANKKVIRDHAIRILQSVVDTKAGKQTCIRACARMKEKIDAEFNELVEVKKTVPKKRKKAQKSNKKRPRRNLNSWDHVRVLKANSPCPLPLPLPRAFNPS